MALYVECANAIRVLFYEKKAGLAQEGDKGSRVLELSRLLIGSLKAMLSAREERGGRGGLVGDRGVYLNDKLLGRLYGEISDGFTGHRHQRQTSETSLQN
jgi:hypothetical protein